MNVSVDLKAYSPECVEEAFCEFQLTREDSLAEVSLPGATSSHAVAKKKHPKVSVPAG